MTQPDPRHPVTTQVSPPEGQEPPRDVIDVDALMADLRRRVADKKARGLYTVDALVSDAAETIEPWGLEDLERLRALSVQRVDLAGTASTKPVVGGLIFEDQAQARARHEPAPVRARGPGQRVPRAPAGLPVPARPRAHGVQLRVEAAQAESAAGAERLREVELDVQRELGQLAGRAEEVADTVAALAEG